ncbi:potassium-transporting ATPase subunit KdpA [Planctellipticum variicoloris]|uniref:potassium-transporting ATPase subunit KdpA n=1 Tax=Planctellipticum variicoloris TaxID=3064265 RepID=UPI003013D0CE|nr:potassium-transporting ATPase subunit KdpA [Planctomycetaceae bacterium SH412]
MTATAWIEIAAYFAVLLALVKPLGWFMARVYAGEPCGLDAPLKPLERGLYRIAGVKPEAEMTWRQYAIAVLLFNALGALAVYGLQRAQGWLPLNPQHLPGVAPDLAFNTAVSFATNTNWQAYSGESTLSDLSQMLGLAVQNFLSAATGMAVLVALIRGITRKQVETIGNFWVDVTRSTLFILLPLSFVLAVALVSQGVVQSFAATVEVPLAVPQTGPDGQPVTMQSIPLGPAASQIAIKQLGTNGGGFFGVNSAHPLENPTPLSNFLQVLAILLIPAALCYTFGDLVGDKRQGWAILAAMLLIFVPLTLGCVLAEQAGNPRLTALGVDPGAGNMEGKEVRLGVGASALWAGATTAASNGSVNSMHDSYTPLGGLVPMWLMQLGEVVFGGVGSGLYGMLVFAIVAVFIAGLMVGRTPEYLGKKIEAREMKLASLVILIPPMVVLGGTAVALSLEAGRASITNPGPHGLSQVLYAFSSAGNNNGSAFAGLGVNTLFYNLMLGFAMLLSRFWLIVPVLAIAGALARKKGIPVSAGTLPTHTPLFVVMLAGIVVLVGALTFVPALALGPIVEHLQLHAGR